MISLSIHPQAFETSGVLSTNAQRASSIVTGATNYSHLFFLRHICEDIQRRNCTPVLRSLVPLRIILELFSLCFFFFGGGGGGVACYDEHVM